MSKTLITNVSGSALALPAPYRGVLPAGARAILSDSPDVVLANLGGAQYAAGVFSLDLAADAQTTSPQSAGAAAVSMSGGPVAGSGVTAAAVASTATAGVSFPNSSVLHVDALLVGRRTDGGNAGHGCVVQISASYRKDASGAVTQIRSDIVSVLNNDDDLDLVSASSSTSGGAVILSAVGVTGASVSWSCKGAAVSVAL